MDDGGGRVRGESLSGGLRQPSLIVEGRSRERRGEGREGEVD
jgi:hypothetical protein